MYGKKTEVITFRTTPEVKQKLEDEAFIREWTVAKLVEKIVKEYTTNKDDIPQTSYITNITFNQGGK